MQGLPLANGVGNHAIWAGKVKLKTVPQGWLAWCPRYPPCCSMTVRHKLSPRPMPSSLVVKKGVKSCAATACEMPGPKSATSKTSQLLAALEAAGLTVKVSSRRVGKLAGISLIACMALRAKFRRTCSTMVRSQTTAGKSWGQ